MTNWIHPWADGTRWQARLARKRMIRLGSEGAIIDLVARAAPTNVATHSYGVPVVRGGPTSPRYNINLFNPYDEAGPAWRSNVNSAGPVPIPLGAQTSHTVAEKTSDTIWKTWVTTDRHLCIWEPSTRRFWDLWKAFFDDKTSTWWAAAGYTGITDEDSIAPSDLAGATAANFPLLGGLIRPEGMAYAIRNNTSLGHPLVFCSPIRQARHYPPATHHGGARDNGFISEGSLIDFDPAIEVERLQIKPWEKVILRTLQRRGAYHRDGGGSTGFYAEDTINRAIDPWPELGMGSKYDKWPYAFFTRNVIPWNRLRVLDPNQELIR